MNTSIYIPDELAEEFDEALFERKVEGEFDRDMSRSEAIRMLMREFIREQEGNAKATVDALAAD